MSFWWPCCRGSWLRRGGGTFGCQLCLVVNTERKQRIWCGHSVDLIVLVVESVAVVLSEVSLNAHRAFVSTFWESNVHDQHNPSGTWHTVARLRGLAGIGGRGGSFRAYSMALGWPPGRGGAHPKLMLRVLGMPLREFNNHHTTAECDIFLSLAAQRNRPLPTPATLKHCAPARQHGHFNPHRIVATLSGGSSSV